MDSVNEDLSVMRMDVEGRRRKGRLKRRWMDSVNVDLRVVRMDVEEKERKTEVEVDGQCECRLEVEGTVGGRGVKPGCVEITGQRSRKSCGER